MLQPTVFRIQPVEVRIGGSAPDRILINDGGRINFSVGLIGPNRFPIRCVGSLNFTGSIRIKQSIAGETDSASHIAFFLNTPYLGNRRMIPVD
ncbi:hypothetical protein SDC9_116048 [bioreactor metagenome]|uniref:Uncharacterized protein n=1 Tax=bioreactor metagenome TaxID=1076179 RepID=A0A645C572_9ZZZZ